MAEGMDLTKLTPLKRRFIISMLHYLKEDSSKADPDTKESLDVAQQCIQAAYGVNVVPSQSCEELTDIFGAFKEADEKNGDAQIQAEQYKVYGNEYVRAGQHAKAIEMYTKAINLDGTNAVYYCNRAAAYGRLGDEENVIADCNTAIKLDPNYGKAYGRLGVAYANLEKYKEAIEAYRKAMEVDPGNPTYEQNLKISAGRMLSSPTSPLPTAQMVDVAEIVRNPDLLNFAAHMLSEPTVRNVVDGILRMEEAGNSPNIDTLLEMGHQLASQLEETNPTFINNLRRQFDTRPPGDGAAQGDNSNDKDGNAPSDKKER